MAQVTAEGVDSIPGPLQPVKDLVLPQLWHRSQLQLGSIPGPGTSICCKCGQKNPLKTDGFDFIKIEYFCGMKNTMDKINS